MHAYVDNMDFTNLDFDVAIRCACFHRPWLCGQAHLLRLEAIPSWLPPVFVERAKTIRVLQLCPALFQSDDTHKWFCSAA